MRSSKAASHSELGCRCLSVSGWMSQGHKTALASHAVLPALDSRCICCLIVRGQRPWTGHANSIWGKLPFWPQNHYVMYSKVTFSGSAYSCLTTCAPKLTSANAVLPTVVLSDSLPDNLSGSRTSRKKGKHLANFACASQRLEYFGKFSFFPEGH